MSGLAVYILTGIAALISFESRRQGLHNLLSHIMLRCLWAEQQLMGQEVFWSTLQPNQKISNFFIFFEDARAHDWNSVHNFCTTNSWAYSCCQQRDLSIAIRIIEPAQKQALRYAFLHKIQMLCVNVLRMRLARSTRESHSFVCTTICSYTRAE